METKGGIEIKVKHIGKEEVTLLVRIVDEDGETIQRFPEIHTLSNGDTLTISGLEIKT